MNKKEMYSILFEAYEQYQKTGNRHFDVFPKNQNYIIHAINTIPYLKDNGYIEQVSDNLLLDTTNVISLVPLEPMSFDITRKGILFAETSREL